RSKLAMQMTVPLLARLVHVDAWACDRAEERGGAAPERPVAREAPWGLAPTNTALPRHAHRHEIGSDPREGAGTRLRPAALVVERQPVVLVRIGHLRAARGPLPRLVGGEVPGR